MVYYFLAILAVFFWSFNAVVGRDLIYILTPWQIAFFRWFIAFLLLIPSTWKDIWNHRRLLWQHRKLVFWQALIGITLSNTFVYIASYSVTAIQMSLISVTGPMFLILFSVLFSGLKISLRQKVGFLTTAVGLMAVVLKGHFSWEAFDFQWGDLWMLAMAGTFGFYSFLNTKKPKVLKQITLLSLVIFLGMLMCIPPFICETIKSPLTLEHLNSKVIWIMIYMGVCNSVLAYLFWNLAIVKKGTVRVGMLYYLMPIFTTIEACLILGEHLVMAHVYGGLLILGGILLTNWKANHNLRIERP